MSNEEAPDGAVRLKMERNPVPNLAEIREFIAETRHIEGPAMHPQLREALEYLEEFLAKETPSSSSVPEFPLVRLHDAIRRNAAAEVRRLGQEEAARMKIAEDGLPVSSLRRPELHPMVQSSRGNAVKLSRDLAQAQRQLAELRERAEPLNRVYRGVLGLLVELDYETGEVDETALDVLAKAVAGVGVAEKDAQVTADFERALKGAVTTMTDESKRHVWERGFAGGRCKNPGCTARSDRISREYACPSTNYDPRSKTDESPPVDLRKEVLVQVKNCRECPMLSYDTHEAYSWCSHPDKDSPDSTDDEIACDGLPKACPLRKGALVVERFPPH